jgi:hypothetical protein
MQHVTFAHLWGERDKRSAVINASAIGEVLPSQVEEVALKDADFIGRPDLKGSLPTTPRRQVGRLRSREETIAALDCEPELTSWPLCEGRRLGASQLKLWIW